MIVRPNLPKLTDRSLEIVGFDRDIKHIAVDGGFLQGRELAVRILAAVIHVVADPRTAAADLAKSERCRISRVQTTPAVIRNEHSTACLRSQKGIPIPAFGIFPARHSIHIAGDGFIDPLSTEKVIVGDVGGNLRRSLPSRLRIGPIKRNHLAFRHRIYHPRPTRLRKKRHIHASLDRKFFERHQIFRRARILVVELDPDHRPAILPKVTLHLQADLMVETLHRGEIFRVLRPQPPALGCRPLLAFLDPVRKSSIARLAIAPRPDSHNRHQAHIPANLEKAAEIFSPLPIPLPLDFLMMIPEDISGNDADSPIPHFDQRLAPFLMRVSGKMELPDHWKPRTPIKSKVPTIDRDFTPRGIFIGTELKVSRSNRPRLSNNQNPRLNLHRRSKRHRQTQSRSKNGF